MSFFLFPFAIVVVGFGFILVILGIFWIGYKAGMMDARTEDAQDATATSPKNWRCFHCDEVFTDRGSAVEHFGTSCTDNAACQISAKEIREMEKQLSRYRNEDTDLHRHLAHLQGEHQVALRRAEEAGYENGLRDGRLLRQ